MDDTLTVLGVLVPCLGLILVVLFFSTFFTVEQQSVAIIERFGKFIRMARAGLNFKIPLVDRLRLAVEMAQVRWPRSWTVLTDEMKRYERDVSEKGTITFSAPSGYHDDCVIALALANTQRFAGPPPDRHMGLTANGRGPDLLRRPGEYAERSLP